jgi:basic membrane protein A
MIKKLKVLLLSTVVAVGTWGCAKSDKVSINETYKISLVLDEGGVNDQSFNQSSWEGALRAKDHYEVDVNYIESKSESEYLSNIETAIDNNSDLIIGVGFKLTDTIEEASKLYPNQKFAIIDGTYDNIPSNVHSILFNEEEAGYCVGLIASKITKTNKVGFVGGMDIPSVTGFKVGFEKALKEESPDVKLFTQYANSFTDSAKGKAIAQSMIKDNVDIIFSAGGGVNTGVWEACVENNVKAIGVDMPSSQFSKSIITSALKNIGIGVESTIKDLIDNNFQGGKVKVFDLSNGGVGYEKTNLIPQEVIDFTEDKIKAN